MAPIAATPMRYIVEAILDGRQPAELGVYVLRAGFPVQWGEQPGLSHTGPGPAALNFTTQSRTICSVTPPIRAASVRVAPS